MLPATGMVRPQQVDSRMGVGAVAANRGGGEGTLFVRYRPFVGRRGGFLEGLEGLPHATTVFSGLVARRSAKTAPYTLSKVVACRSPWSS